MKINIGQAISAILVFFMAIIEAILGIRFVLKLLAANSQAEFTNFIYNASDTLTAPFQGVFPEFKVVGFTLEISTFLGMVVYGIAGAIFFYLAKHIGSVDLKSSQNSKPIVEVSNQTGSSPQYTMPPQMSNYPTQQTYQPPMQTQVPLQPPPMSQFQSNVPSVPSQQVPTGFQPQSPDTTSPQTMTQNPVSSPNNPPQN